MDGSNPEIDRLLKKMKLVVDESRSLAKKHEELMRQFSELHREYQKLAEQNNKSRAVQDLRDSRSMSSIAMLQQ